MYSLRPFSAKHQKETSKEKDSSLVESLKQFLKDNVPSSAISHSSKAIDTPINELTCLLEPLATAPKTNNLHVSKEGTNLSQIPSQISKRRKKAKIKLYTETENS